MAKPPNSNTSLAYNLFIKADPEAALCDTYQSIPTVPSKRARVESSEILASGEPDDGPTKTRRVNPQRLASRLDSNLVAEMEAHIVPGAKMPTFDIRKDLQERYNVDRRHIYDYFHSRGKYSR